MNEFWMFYCDIVMYYPDKITVQKLESDGNVGTIKWKIICFL